MISDQTTTSAVAITDKPLSQKKRKYKDFNVSNEVFRRFQTGRNKFERWSKYLDLTDEKQFEIYKYATRNRDAVVVLRNEESGALKAIRRKASNE
tara:strand:+ start:50 stop:334 length:285 start_codon:yes stop_codon:yes gene_type:complete